MDEKKVETLCVFYLLTVWGFILLLLAWFYFVFLSLRGFVVVLGLCLCTVEAFKVEPVGKERGACV